jgi:hypothetical protein
MSCPLLCLSRPLAFRLPDPCVLSAVVPRSHPMPLSLIVPPSPLFVESRSSQSPRGWRRALDTPTCRRRAKRADFCPTKSQRCTTANEYVNWDKQINDAGIIPTDRQRRRDGERSDTQSEKDRERDAKVRKE